MGDSAAEGAPGPSPAGACHRELNPLRGTAGGGSEGSVRLIMIMIKIVMVIIMRMVVTVMMGNIFLSVPSEKVNIRVEANVPG